MPTSLDLIALESRRPAKQPYKTILQKYKVTLAVRNLNIYPNIGHVKAMWGRAPLRLLR